MRWFLILSLIFGCGVSKRKRDRMNVSEQYDLGLRYLKRGQYVKAIEQFNRLRNYHRDDPLSVKAELAIGDVYFKKHEWDQARMAYEDFSRMHPRHPDLDYVVYQVGMSMYKKAPLAAGRDQTWSRQAVNTWSGFVSRFPDSEHVAEVGELLEECRERLAVKELWIARFYQRRKSWNAVQERTEGMLRTYPGTPWSMDGLRLLAVSSAWQGLDDRARVAVEQLTEKDVAAGKRLAARVARIKPKAEKLLEMAPPEPTR
jgi:outer membrane protein assembly factor BamD